MGSSVCRLVAVKTDRLVVEGLDAIDGSPVIDVKPYIREFAPRGKVYQPGWVSEVMTHYFARKPGMMRPVHWPDLKTDRTVIRLQSDFRPSELCAFFQRNRLFFDATNPATPDSQLCEEAFARRAIVTESLFDAGLTVNLAVALRSSMDIPIATICFSDIARNIVQSCVLGYALDQSLQGQGLMTEALRTAVAYMFDLQRIQSIRASYWVENVRSERLLNRLGFQKVGLMPASLFFNGAWRDHILTVKNNPNVTVPG
jgi:ribosomal-protein-alanine N-acetyltransferase